MRIFDTTIFAISWPFAILGANLYWPMAITNDQVLTAITAGYCAVASMWLIDYLG